MKSYNIIKNYICDRAKLDTQTVMAKICIELEVRYFSNYSL